MLSLAVANGLEDEHFPKRHLVDFDLIHFLEAGLIEVVKELLLHGNLVQSSLFLPRELQVVAVLKSEVLTGTECVKVIIDIL